MRLMTLPDNLDLNKNSLIKKFSLRSNTTELLKIFMNKSRSSLTNLTKWNRRLNKRSMTGNKIFKAYSKITWKEKPFNCDLESMNSQLLNSLAGLTILHLHYLEKSNPRIIRFSWWNKHLSFLKKSLDQRTPCN